jgi:hypothetical protein
LAHNISIATIEASADTSTVAKRAKERVTGVGRYKWQVALMSGVATANFCVVTEKQRYAAGSNGIGRWVKDGFELFGREENVASAIVLFDYLRQTTERLARDYVGGDRHRMLSREATSYKEGCGERLASRVTKRHREAMAAQKAASAAPSNGRGVALVMDDWAEAERCQNEDYRLGLTPGTTARRAFISTLEGKAWNAAWAALKPLADVTDKTMLSQAATEAVMDLVGPTGLEGKELEALMDYAVGYTVSHHIRNAEERANPPKRKKERAYRPSRGKAEKPRDWAAQDAGRRDADEVSLDRQLGERAASLKLKGGR